MARVAPMPSISGIWMSIRIKSNTFLSSKSRAIRPSSATTARCPAFSSSFLTVKPDTAIVLGDEDAQPREIRRGVPGPGLVAWLPEHAGHLEGHGQIDGRPRSRFALHGQLPAQELDDPGYDGKPKPCPLVLPDVRAFALDERLEDGPQLVIRYSDAGVADDEQDMEARIAQAGQRIQFHPDPALLGELDGVAPPG